MSEYPRRFEFIGRAYTLAILEALRADGPMRYSELEEAVDASSTATFVSRLDSLQEYGLIERESFDEVPPRVEYSITDAGETCRDHLIAVADLLEASRQQ